MTRGAPRPKPEPRMRPKAEDLITLNINGQTLQLTDDELFELMVKLCEAAGIEVIDKRGKG